MNYLEEQTDGEAMINSIKNGDQPLPRVTQVSIAGTSSNEQPPLKYKFMWHMLVSEYGEQDRKAAVLYEYETFKATEGELLLDTYIRYLQVINDLKKCGYSKDNCELNFKFLNNLQPEWKHKTKDMLMMLWDQRRKLLWSDPLALIAEKTNVSKSSGADDFSELKKITALLAKAFNQRKFYSKPTNNNLRTSSTSQSANKKQEFVKTDNKKVEKKDDEKKRDMSRVKCYNCKKEGHFAKDCKKAKVKDYEYYKTKMLLAKKDKDEQVLLAEDQAWMESSSDSDQEIKANMVFMAQIEKVLSDSEASSSSTDEKIFEMSQDVITVGSTMRIPLLYRGEYSQWRERFMNYLKEQTDGEAMINSIQNGDQLFPVIAQVSLAGNAQNAPPTLKDPKFWTAKEKKTRKIDRLARSLLIQGLPNDIYSLIDSNETAKDLWDALKRQMHGSEYAEQDRKAVILYEYKTFKATEGEQLLDTYLCYLQVINDLNKQTKNLMDINIDALYNILKQNQGDVNDALGYKKKAVMVTSDPLALVAEKIKVRNRKEKVKVQTESEGSDDEDINDLKKITTLLAKAFNRKKYYAKLSNNNLRTSSANKKPEYVKSVEKKEDKRADEKKRDMSKVKCYNFKKEGHFAKDCKKAKEQSWMESSSDSDQEINANMVFMAQIEKVLSDSDESSSSAEETIA
nr:hypothetical protein [Tanacetum cinerariifolium]